MTRVAAISPLVVKEIRALLPLWVASVVAVVLGLVWRGNDLLIVAYIAGSVAIGAHSVGHEYSYRTLAMALSHPGDRRRLYLFKFVVSATMVLTLAMLAAAVFEGEFQNGPWPFTLLVLTIACGLFLAPPLTMICRSSLAGLFLSGSVLACMWIVTVTVAWFAFGIDSHTAERDIIGPWTFAMTLFCAAAGALGWRQFARLEAGDGSPRAFHVPQWRRARAGARVYRPFAALALKELHLQQMTFAISIFFVIVWGFLVLAHRYIPSWSNAPIAAVMLMYCMALTIVIGALASAEEHHNGTQEWQLLQPSPAWQQWMVKVGVALALALAFAFALPLLLMGVLPQQAIRLPADVALLVVLLTASSLYVSSLTSSGVRAMVLSLPAGIGAAYFVQVMNDVLWRVTYWIAGARMADAVTGAAPSSIDGVNAALAVARVLVIVFIAFLLWLGFVNHRSPARTARRVVQQVVAIALFIALGIAGVGGVLAFYELRTRSATII